jgi:hypothetical protein
MRINSPTRSTGRRPTISGVHSLCQDGIAGTLTVYVGYPAVAEPSAFVLDIGPDGLRAAAATFDQARDGQILAALVPEAVRMTATNNRFGWLRANPLH